MHPRRRGRPKKTEAERRTTEFRVYVNDLEAAALAQLAVRHRCQGVSGLLRLAITRWLRSQDGAPPP